MDEKNNSFSLTMWGCFLMTMVFLVLKLCGKIAWAWIWIFSPMWLLFAAIVALLIVFLLTAGVGYLIKKAEKLD